MDHATTSLITLRVLTGNDPVSLNALQAAMQPYSHAIITFWMAVSATVVVVVCAQLFKEWRISRNRT